MNGEFDGMCLPAHTIMTASTLGPLRVCHWRTSTKHRQTHTRAGSCYCLMSLLLHTAVQQPALRVGLATRWNVFRHAIAASFELQRGCVVIGTGSHVCLPPVKRRILQLAVVV